MVLAEQMGKAKSYISILENGNIDHIKIKDFQNLVLLLLPQYKIAFTNENISLLVEIIENGNRDVESILSGIENMFIYKQTATETNDYNSKSINDEKDEMILKLKLENHNLKMQIEAIRLLLRY